VIRPKKLKFCRTYQSTEGTKITKDYLVKLIRYKFGFVCLALILIGVFVILYFQPVGIIKDLFISTISGAVIGLIMEFFLGGELDAKIRRSLEEMLLFSESFIERLRPEVINRILMGILSHTLNPASFKRNEETVNLILSMMRIPIRRNFRYLVRLHKESKDILGVIHRRFSITVEYEIENTLPTKISLFSDKRFKVYVVSSRDKQLSQKFFGSEHVVHSIYIKDLNVEKVKNKEIRPEDVLEKIFLNVQGERYGGIPEIKAGEKHLEYSIPCNRVVLNPGAYLNVSYTIDVFIPDLEPNTFRTIVPYLTRGCFLSFYSEIPLTNINAVALLNQPIFDFLKTPISYEISTPDLVFPGNGAVFLWSIMGED